MAKRLKREIAHRTPRSPEQMTALDMVNQILEDSPYTWVDGEHDRLSVDKNDLQDLRDLLEQEAV